MDTKYCPLCGEENKCMGSLTGHGICWCNQEEFPAGIFELVPEQSIRKQCICKNCLEKYKEGMKTS